MKKSIMVIVTAFLISLWLSQGIYAAEKQINLEFAQAFPKNHRVAIVLDEMNREIEKRTAGRVKITLYPENTLVAVQQTYDSVTKGIADIGFGALAYNRGRFPLMEVLDLPIGYKDSVSGSRMANAFYKHFNPKELSDVKVFFLISQPPGIFHTQKPIRKVEDLKGLKVRVPGGNVAEVVSAFGAVPVAMSMGDAYDSLRKGVVNALMAAYEPLENRKLGEVVKYSIENWRAAYGTTGYVVMNKDRFNSLPPDIQKIMEQTANEYAEKAAKGWDEFEAQAKQWVVQRGNEIIKLSKSEEDKSVVLVKPLFDTYVKEKTAMGLPAKEALAFCQEYVTKK